MISGEQRLEAAKDAKIDKPGVYSEVFRLSDNDNRK